MRSITVWVGALVFTIGAGVFLIEREYISGDKAARVRLEQGKLQLERFDEDGLRKGIDDLTAVVAQFPDSIHARSARYHLAEAYERLGLRDVALGKYKKLLEMPLTEELKTHVRFKIAKLQVMRNYSDEGMNQLLQLLNSTGGDKALRAEIYLEIGKYYQRKGMGKDAIRNYQNALTENPENREVRAALGYSDADYKNSVALHGILDKTETVQEKEVKPAAESKVEKPAGKYDLRGGIQAFSSGEYGKAVRLLAPAANSTGRDSEDALYYLGNAYLKLKQYRNAIRYLNKAVSNSYKDRDEAAFIKKGEAYYLNNQFDRALRVFAFARSHYPNGKYAQIARDWESETRRMLGDKTGVKSLEGDDDDDDDEDEDVLGGVAHSGDEAGPRPKRRRSQTMAKSEEITLDDDADVTP